jgi:hypothetical protein
MALADDPWNVEMPPYVRPLFTLVAGRLLALPSPVSWANVRSLIAGLLPAPR